AQFSVAELCRALPMSRTLMLCIGMSVGAALGVAVAILSRVVSARLGKNEFWTELPRLTRVLAAGSDSDAFFSTYGRLLRLLGAYLARNAIQLVVSFAPVIATVLICGPWVMEKYNRRAEALAIYPPQNLTVKAGGEQWVSNEESGWLRPIPRA